MHNWALRLWPLPSRNLISITCNACPIVLYPKFDRHTDIAHKHTNSHSYRQCEYWPCHALCNNSTECDTIQNVEAKSVHERWSTHTSKARVRFHSVAARCWQSIKHSMARGVCTRESRMGNRIEIGSDYHHFDFWLMTRVPFSWHPPPHPPCCAAPGWNSFRWIANVAQRETRSAPTSVVTPFRGAWEFNLNWFAVKILYNLSATTSYIALRQHLKRV